MDEKTNPESDDERKILFQAAQELLLNAVKHAKADHVCLTLKSTPGWVRLGVADRGVGFDEAKVQNGGFGLFQICQRLESLGGFLLVKSAISQGSTMTAVIPGDAAAAND